MLFATLVESLIRFQAFRAISQALLLNQREIVADLQRISRELKK
jgi:hypothetical protein